MNKLNTQKRAQILGMLVEGNSLRATSRMAGVSFNTVLKFASNVGCVMANFHNDMVRNLPAPAFNATRFGLSHTVRKRT